MTVLCCCRSSKSTCQQTNPVTVEQPTEPPPVKLGESPYSQSNIEVAPSQPILTGSTPSRIGSPMRQAMLDPATLNVEDSDEEDGIFRNTRNSSITTLEVIRTRFIRRRSPASDTKPRSQSSVIRNSDEEMARRAELKRIMHKRIQEELKREDEQGSPSRDGAQRRNHDNASPLELPRGGPRDTIEFSVEEMHEINANGLQSTSPEFIPLAHPVDESQVLALRRRSSVQESARHSGDITGTELQAVVMKTGSPSQMPSSPELAPVHLSSLQNSPSTHSWRLSLSADQLTSIMVIHEGSTHRFSESDVTEDEGYGVFKSRATCSDDGDKSGAPEKPENVSGDVAGQDTANEQDINQAVENEHRSSTAHRDSSLDLWLRSQQLQPSFGGFSEQNKTMALAEIPESYSREIEAATGYNHAEPPTIVGQAVVGQDITNQNRLPGMRPQSRDSQGSTDKKSYVSAESNNPHTPEMGDNHIITSGGALTVPQVSSASHYTSSRYTTMPNSTQPSRKSSRLSLRELLGSMKGTTLAPISNIYRSTSSNRRTETEKSGVSSYKTAPNELPASNIAGSSIHSQRRRTMETESLAMSDTVSFKQRENELKSIEQRFGKSHRRRYHTLPMSSKFHEDFDEPQALIGPRPSLFSKLRLPSIGKERPVRGHTVRVKSEGAILKDSIPKKPQELMNAIPIANTESSASLDGDKKSRLEESPTGLWKRSIRTDSDSRRPLQRETLSSKLHAYLHDHEKDTDAILDSEKKAAKHVRENSIAEKTDDHSGPSRSYSPIITHQTLQPQVDIQGQRTPASDISSRLLHTWSRQLSTPSPSFQPVSNIDIVHCGPRRLLTPPASWAKWPSHTRAARSGPAGIGERVISRDFAVEATSNTTGQGKTMDKTRTKSKSSLKSVPRSISNSLGRAMKRGLANMIISKEGSPTMKDSSGKHNTFLEYPELELLPMKGGYKDLQALEDQIDTMKHGGPPPEGRSRNPSIDGIKPSLGVRLAYDVHKIRCGDHDMHNRDITDGMNSPSHHRSHLQTPEGFSGTTTGDKLETPPSSVYYDDCVPKHMLDENDSIESHKTVLVKRSKSHAAGQKSGPDAVNNNRYKYMTWHGRSRGQPVLLQSTLEFGAELDGMLAAARAKAMQTRSAEDAQ